MDTQQGVEQGFSGRKMAEQCRQPHVGPAGNVSHGRVDPMLGHHVARNFKYLIIILLVVGSHKGC